METYESSTQFNPITITSSYSVQFLHLFSFNFDSVVNPSHIIRSGNSYNIQFSFPCTGSIVTQPSEKQSYFFS